MRSWMPWRCDCSPVRLHNEVSMFPTMQKACDNFASYVWFVAAPRCRTSLYIAGWLSKAIRCKTKTKQRVEKCPKLSSDLGKLEPRPTMKQAWPIRLVCDDHVLKKQPCQWTKHDGASFVCDALEALAPPSPQESPKKSSCRCCGRHPEKKTLA